MTAHVSLHINKNSGRPLSEVKKAIEDVLKDGDKLGDITVVSKKVGK